MFFLCVTLAKNNHWISFLMPKVAFLSQLEGIKKKAIFSMQALFCVLEVRDRYLQVLQKRRRCEERGAGGS